MAEIVINKKADVLAHKLKRLPLPVDQPKRGVFEKVLEWGLEQDRPLYILELGSGNSILSSTTTSATTSLAKLAEEVRGNMMIVDNDPGSRAVSQVAPGGSGMHVAYKGAEEDMFCKNFAGQKVDILRIGISLRYVTAKKCLEFILPKMNEKASVVVLVSAAFHTPEIESMLTSLKYAKDASVGNSSISLWSLGEVRIEKEDKKKNGKSDKVKKL